MKSMSRRRTRRAVALRPLLVVIATTIGIVASGALAELAAQCHDRPPYDNLRFGMDPNEPNLAPSNVEAAFIRPDLRQEAERFHLRPATGGERDRHRHHREELGYGINATTGKVQWKRHFGIAGPGGDDRLRRSGAEPREHLHRRGRPLDEHAVTSRRGSRRATPRRRRPPTTTTWMQAISVTTGKEAAGFPRRAPGHTDNTPGVPFTDSSELRARRLLFLGGVVLRRLSPVTATNPPYRGVVIGVSTTAHDITAMLSDEAAPAPDQDSAIRHLAVGRGLVSDGPKQILLTTGNGIAPRHRQGGPTRLRPCRSRSSASPSGATEHSPPPTTSPERRPLARPGRPGSRLRRPHRPPVSVLREQHGPRLLVPGGQGRADLPAQTATTSGSGTGTGRQRRHHRDPRSLQRVWGHPAAYGGEGRLGLCQPNRPAAATSGLSAMA